MLLLVSLQLLIAMKYFDSLVYYTPSRSFDNLNSDFYISFLTHFRYISENIPTSKSMGVRILDSIFSAR